jgi:hypothetical protein
VDYLPAPTATNTFLDDRRDHFSRERMGTRLRFRGPCLDSSKSSRWIFLAPFHNCTVRISKMTCDLSYRPALLLY